MKKKIKVVELFAGVGGFRLGLEGHNGLSATSNYTKKLNSNYEVVWSNQFEPSTKIQHASVVYENIWGKENHSRMDIEEIVSSEKIDSIPDHDLLVGGFPCQDYSVATTLKNSKGLIGKKGVLWWSIYEILRNKNKSPRYLLLENVDRLLISPSNQRGRDFAIILRSLDLLDFAVEWRIINAADYGFPQRRKRVFIVAYHKSTKLYKQLSESDPKEFILKQGIIAQTFSIVQLNSNLMSRKLEGDIENISESFRLDKRFEKFENTGIMVEGVVHTLKTKPNYDDGYKFLSDVVDLDKKVDDEFYIDDESLPNWEYLKGAKNNPKVNTLGIRYNYSEGAMIFPDKLDRASRTIITGEGGKSPSRFKHVIETKFGRRRLTPVELERLNMFPDNHTSYEGISNAKRAFFMGNALVVGVVEKLGETLSKRIL